VIKFMQFLQFGELTTPSGKAGHHATIGGEFKTTTPSPLVTPLRQRRGLLTIVLILAPFAVFGAPSSSTLSGPQPAIMGGGGNLTGIKGGQVIDQNAYNNIIRGDRSAAVAAAQCDKFDECANYIDKSALAQGRIIAMDPSGGEIARCFATLKNCFAEAGVSNSTCRAALLRCAQPKCSSAVCGDAGSAEGVVRMCFDALGSPAMSLGCQQFGNLPGLVALDLLKANETKQQKVASEQAKASAAAAAAANNSAQAEAMQQQMMQMQQQMAQQQAEAAAAQQQMMQQMVEAQQQSAQASRGSSGNVSEVLSRDQASGALMSEIERMEGALAVLNKTLNTITEYAGCDYKGENCGSRKELKRIAKFKELSDQFFQPFDEVGDRIMDVIDTGFALGADLNNVYMLLESACSRWGLYRAEKTCSSSVGGHNGAGGLCYEKQANTAGSPKGNRGRILNQLIKPLNGTDEIMAEFAAPSAPGGGMRADGFVVGCMSDSATSAGFFGRRKANAGAIDIEPLRQALAEVDRKENIGTTGSNLQWITPGCVGSLGKISAKGGSTTGANRICLNKTDDEGMCTAGTNAVFNIDFILSSVHGLNSSGSCLLSGGGISLQQVDKDLIHRRASNITKEMYSQYNKLNIIAKQVKTMVQQSVLNHQKEEAEGIASPNGQNSAQQRRAEAALLCLQGNTEEVYNCLIGEIGSLIANISPMARADQDSIEKCKALIGKANATLGGGKDANSNVKESDCNNVVSNMLNKMTTLQSTIRGALEKVVNESNRAKAGGAATK
jgi:hypothetical protein